MEDETTITPPDEQPDSLLSQLAAKRQEIADTRDTMIPVPGYDKAPPVLMIKYRLLAGEEFAKIGEKNRRVKSRWERQLFTAVDTMIAACDGLFIDMQDGTPVQPLTIGGEEVLGFTPDLAAALGFADKIDDPNRARDVAMGLFGNNDVMIAQHNIQLSRWMSDTTVDVSEEMYGGNL